MLIKKKHLVGIAGVAVIAFLIGTVLNFGFPNVAGKEEEAANPPTWPLQTYKDSVQISTLEWSSHEEPIGNPPIEKGVVIIDGLNPVDVLFTFSQRQEFLRVTAIGITITATAHGQSLMYARLNVTINDKESILTDEHFYYPYTHELSTESAVILDSEMLEAISLGINNMKLTPTGNMFVYRLSVFIEYEYQAR